MADPFASTLFPTCKAYNKPCLNGGFFSVVTQSRTSFIPLILFPAQPVLHFSPHGQLSLETEQAYGALTGVSSPGHFSPQRFLVTNLGIAEVTLLGSTTISNSSLNFTNIHYSKLHKNANNYMKLTEHAFIFDVQVNNLRLSLAVKTDPGPTSKSKDA